jgi:hypothetical protein
MLVLVLAPYTDVAAGVGRVTRHLLLPLFGSVELLEPAGTLLAKVSLCRGQGGRRKGG